MGKSSKTSSVDRVDKVFRVEQAWRRCLVCEQLFTPEGAREHAVVVCDAVPAKLVNSAPRSLRMIDVGQFVNRGD